MIRWLTWCGRRGDELVQFCFHFCRCSERRHGVEFDSALTLRKPRNFKICTKCNRIKVLFSAAFDSLEKCQPFLVGFSFSFVYGAAWLCLLKLMCCTRAFPLLLRRSRSLTGTRMSCASGVAPAVAPSSAKSAPASTRRSGR